MKHFDQMRASPERLSTSCIIINYDIWSNQMEELIMGIPTFGHAPLNSHWFLTYGYSLIGLSLNVVGELTKELTRLD